MRQQVVLSRINLVTMDGSFPHWTRIFCRCRVEWVGLHPILEQTLAFVFSTWVLKERQRSRVSPKYTGCWQVSRAVPDQETFS